MQSRDATWHRMEERVASARSEAEAWIVSGIGAGVFGAFLVALSFLVVDWLESTPFHTPMRLGAVLFRGEAPAPGTPPSAVLVTAYTVLHGVVFVALGFIGAASLTIWPAPRVSWRTYPVLAGALFVAMELIFVGFGALFDPSLIDTLGGERIAVANGLAAGVMGFALVKERVGHAACT